MIGPRLKACLFVIGRCKQSSLPPPLSDTRRLTHTHFSLRPLSSPLWRCNQDGNKKPVESYCIWMKCFLTLQHQWGRTHSWRVSMPPPSRPCWENGDWSGDLLVRSFSCFFCFFPIAPLFLFAISAGPTSAVPALRRVKSGLLCLFPFLDKYPWQTLVRHSGKAWRDCVSAVSRTLNLNVTLWLILTTACSRMLPRWWRSLNCLHKPRLKICNIPLELMSSFWKTSHRKEEGGTL